MDKQFLFVAFNFFKQVSQRFWMHLGSNPLYMVSKIVDQIIEILKLFYVRHFMDPIYERNLQPKYMLCDGLIAYKHEILNYFMRNCSFLYNNINRFAIFIQY